jgi:hypothetical protein
MKSIYNLSVIVFAAMTGLQPTLRQSSGQAVPAALSAALRDHVKDERFEVVSSIRGLPLGVRNELQALFGSSTLDIANPDAEFQATDVITNPTLPIRRLVAAGCSSDHCLVYYERGGKTHSWLVALFQWTPGATRVEWGGNAGGGLANIGDVRNAVVTGMVKGPVNVW